LAASGQIGEAKGSRIQAFSIGSGFAILRAHLVYAALVISPGTGSWFFSLQQVAHAVRIEHLFTGELCVRVV
jgi:hypothetical protein